MMKNVLLLGSLAILAIGCEPKGNQSSSAKGVVEVSEGAQKQGKLIAQCVTEKDFCETFYGGGGGHPGGGDSRMEVCSPKQKVSIYTADPSMIDSARVIRDSPDPKYWHPEAFRVVISNSGIEEEIVLPGVLSVSKPHWVGKELEHRSVSFAFDKFFAANGEFKDVLLSPSLRFNQYSKNHERVLKELGQGGNGNSMVYAGCKRGTNPVECYTHRQIGVRSSCTLFED